MQKIEISEPIPFELSADGSVYFSDIERWLGKNIFSVLTYKQKLELQKKLTEIGIAA